MIRYRTENFSGLGERDAAEVMAYETFELGNTDILETLEKGLIKNNPELRNQCFDVIDELNNNGYVDDFSCSDKVDFFKEVLEEIKKVTGYDIKYCLWLADLDAVTDKTFYGKDLSAVNDIDAYEVGPIVLSELGYDGTLYGYEILPEPLEKSKEMQEYDEVIGVLSEGEDYFEKYDDILFEQIAETENGYGKNLMEVFQKYSYEPEKIKVINEVLEVFTRKDMKGLLYEMGQEKRESLKDNLKDIIDASESDDLTWAEAEKLDEAYGEVSYKISLLENMKFEITNKNHERREGLDDKTDEKINKFSIKEIENGMYLTEETNGKYTFGREEDRLVFYEEIDAESTLEYLNFETEYCCVLLDESALEKERNPTIDNMIAKASQKRMNSGVENSEVPDKVLVEFDKVLER